MQWGYVRARVNICHPQSHPSEQSSCEDTSLFGVIKMLDRIPVERVTKRPRSICSDLQHMVDEVTY